MCLDGVVVGFLDADGLKQVSLDGADFADAGEVLGTDLHAVLLQPPQVFQRSLGAGRAAAGLEPQSHYPVQHQCEKTDQRMGADALREPMEYRGDLQQTGSASCRESVGPYV